MVGGMFYDNFRNHPKMEGDHRYYPFFDNFRNHPKMEGDHQYYSKIIIIITDINFIISLCDYDSPRVIGVKSLS